MKVVPENGPRPGRGGKSAGFVAVRIRHANRSRLNRDLATPKVAIKVTYLPSASEATEYFWHGSSATALGAARNPGSHFNCLASGNGTPAAKSFRLTG
jgi:hypothetical protein